MVLDLTAATDGNANGLGMADFTTLRAAAKMDWGRTYPNALTSTVATGVALPMVLPNDRLALAAALLTCNAVGREPGCCGSQTPCAWIASGPRPRCWSRCGSIRRSP